MSETKSDQNQKTRHQLYQVLDRFGRVVYARCCEGEAKARAEKIGGKVEELTARGTDAHSFTNDATRGDTTMTATEIIRQEQESQARYEEETFFKGHKITDLRKVFDRITIPGNWKAAWAAAVPHEIVPLVCAATEYFHADRAVIHGIQPGTGKVMMSGSGYRC